MDAAMGRDDVDPEDDEDCAGVWCEDGAIPAKDATSGDLDLPDEWDGGVDPDALFLMTESDRSVPKLGYIMEYSVEQMYFGVLE